MALVGDNSIVRELRLLTSIELYLKANFYSQHPYFLSAYDKHGVKISHSFKNLLPMSVSAGALDSGFSGGELVKKEAILNCFDKTWSSFLCILGLASVTNTNIFSYYPDCGEERFKLLLNCKVEPCPPTKPVVDVHVLFCFHGIVESGNVFQPNHFVPIVFDNKQAGGLKRKLPAQKVSSNLQSKSKKPHSNLVQSKIAFPSLPVPAKTTPIVPGPSTEVSGESETTPVVHFVHEYDVAHYREKAKNLTNLEIGVLIKNVFVPDKNFSFPITNGRSFRLEWLKLYPWLCYSPSQDGAYCLACALFGDRFHAQILKKNPPKNVFSQPFKCWNDAPRNFKNHTGKHGSSSICLHSSTSATFLSLQEQLSGNVQPIDVLISENRRNNISENRKKLIPIVDTIITCARLGLSFRGHRDDSQYHPEVGSYSRGGVGNFIELLNMRVRGGDVVLEDHLKKCPKNASYISKTTQNEIINCCGQVITETIIDEVKQSRFFSIIADEAADCSNKEQMSLVLRFVDSNFNIREDFIKFIHCKWGLAGADLAAVILKALADLSLNIEDCRGQGYDGAGAVAGHVNGLSAHILRLNQKALYTHCFSHRLNLVICNACSVPIVKNIMTRVKELSSFFNNSQNRQLLFEKNISIHVKDSKKKKLKDVCRTRWVERIDGLDVFQDLFIAIFFTLKEMSLNEERQCNPSTSSQATSFLAMISSFQFIVSLVITRHIFDLTLPVTQLLQAKDNDIFDGMELIQTMKNTVNRHRNMIDNYHGVWYGQAINLAREIDVEESLPRICSKNFPVSDPSLYYKCSLTIPVLDHLNSDLNSRFDLSSINVINGLSIIPSKMISLINETGMTGWKEAFKKFSDFYEEDFPNLLALDGELELWQTYWVSNKSSCPNSVASTLKAISFDSFANIKVALRILATLPVTSCECERSFSAMRRLKNYTRSTMVEERLNGLALMEIHQDRYTTFSSAVHR